jgi:hypothetical protein
MKFAYVDESGDQGHGDVFVMAGVVLDAYRLRKYTAKFDNMISDFLARHQGAPKELKTQAFITGTHGWSKVDANDRKSFLSEICDLAAECARTFVMVLSFAKFSEAIKKDQGFGKSYWLNSAMYVAALIQKKMQSERKNKGLTVLICDDNKQDMANLADALHEGPNWFDPLYQQTKRRQGETVWEPIKADERFDQIVNCAFAIKSQHSSLIQVADAVAYVYRRHFELKSDKEAWVGEQKYIASLFEKLDPKREKLGHNPGGASVAFYKAVAHKDWAL